MQTPEAIDRFRDYRAGCIGSEHFYRHHTGLVVYTDGVNMLGDLLGAHWLIDIIASLQTRPAVRAESFQVWTLKRDEHADDSLILIAEDGDRGPGPVRLTGELIHYSDFPADLLPLELYCERGSIGMVLMLPEER